MAEERIDTKSAAEGNGWLRCLGRFVFTAPVVLVSYLLVAPGDPSPRTATVVVVLVWLWLALAVFVGIIQAMMAMDAARNRNPWAFPRGVPRVCAWVGVLLLAVSTGALFAGGEPTLATTMEVFLILRLAVGIVPVQPPTPGKSKDIEQDFTPITSGAGLFGLVILASAVWLALGMPPAWAESMILTWFWLVAVGMVAIHSLLAFGLTTGRSWMAKQHNESLRRSGAPPDTRGWPSTPPITPEPPRTALQQFNMWVWRASWLVVTWALWTAGQQLLAGLYLLGSVLKLTMRVHMRRQKHGDSARIDFLARAVHFIVWRPLVIGGTVAGAVGTAAVIIPLTILCAIWERIAGAPKPAEPWPQTGWEREQRLTRARVRRATASYRLREAFERPGGFVYFLHSEPHQRVYFLGAGGSLSGVADRVIARNWRKDVSPERKTAGDTQFRQTPEGALLHVNGIGSMQKDLPFIAVVPARGMVQIFRLGEAYRSRNRDKGAALIRAETELRAAIAVMLGSGAGGAGPC